MRALMLDFYHICSVLEAVQPLQWYCMNFISHYFLDKERTDSMFFLGVSTPDLLSGFDRSVRLKPARLPLLMENEAPQTQIQFYNGILRHFEVDRIFHSSDFFYKETHIISRELLKHFSPNEVKRSFFVSHILFELILDRILISGYTDILFSYYKHFREADVMMLVNYTEWITRSSLRGYDRHLHQFAERQMLYRYTDWEFLIRVVKEILAKVNIHQANYLDTQRFLAVMDQYEAELTKRYQPAFEKLSAELCKLPSHS